MNSFEEYLKKYSDMFKSRRLRRTRKGSTNLRSTTPISFLATLNPKKNLGRTPTEEIFNTENKIFFSKIVNSRNSSPVKTSPHSRNVSPFKQSIIDSPWSSKRSHIVLASGRKEDFLPSLTSRKESLSKTFRRESELKIEKIMKDCEETRVKLVESSSRLGILSKQECQLARHYTKEMQWTADKIMEVNTYGNEIMQTLFDEHKQSKDYYETEKNLLVKKLNENSEKNFKAKANQIKKLMTERRHKLISKVM